jgi:hypothetical protein
MNFLTFSQLVTNIQSSVSALLTGLVDFTVGKPLGALVNANADGYQALSAQSVQILANTRLQTSDDAAVDTFFAQFPNFARNPAVTATGQVTFSRYVAASAALIVPGLSVKTVDGTLSFTVTTDQSNPLWNSGMGGYLVPISTLSATVPVTAAAPGSAYNVQAGTISLISGSVAGIDLVTNSVGITNGVDAETSPAAITRFWQYLNTRAEATQAAVEYAITTVQSGLSYSIVENPQGRAGSFNVYVDDGSGSPSTALLASIQAAIDPIRPLSVPFTVNGPQVLLANISLNISPAYGYQKTDLIGPVAQAITALVNGLGIGNALAFYDVATTARNIEGVAKIENLLVNGATQDIGGGVAQSVHISGIEIN